MYLWSNSVSPGDSLILSFKLKIEAYLLAMGNHGHRGIMDQARFMRKALSIPNFDPFESVSYDILHDIFCFYEHLSTLHLAHA